MPLERETIVSAIHSAPNLTVAAKQLGASRRTLQNRMRQYDLPRGRGGRPKELLPYHRHVSVGGLLTLAGIAGAAVLVGRWFAKMPAVTPKMPATSNPYLAGTDILGSL